LFQRWEGVCHSEGHCILPISGQLVKYYFWIYGSSI
jgi:hypothetical protein